ncbi:MAG: Glutaredoxin-3 [Alphaproteobacteria bacterium MarineAlpha6_Bin3]|nr:MAG: Glutaredoxin-3 [Alphaproteobacteria bacterium MarineAlpha6_Bin3]|tara:strand:+ start:11017 stop:11283 length:267 start_codon:yes stop_codon:yes gene_type:complete
MSKNYKIIVYTSNDCTFCNSAKILLKNKKLNFKEINISKNENLKKEMIKKTNGLMTVPQIFINSHHIGGFEELNNLENKKKLDDIINQ